jgi:hypothetical protein
MNMKAARTFYFTSKNLSFFFFDLILIKFIRCCHDYTVIFKTTPHDKMDKTLLKLDKRVTIKINTERTSTILVFKLVNSSTTYKARDMGH